MIISNGATVSAGDYNYNIIGFNATSSNNSVLVTGAGSTWSVNPTNGDLVIGSAGSGNTLTIADGGTVVDWYGTLGASSTSSNNSVLVTGRGSTWSNTEMEIGIDGSGNSITIADGGTVVGGYAYIGEGSSSNNTVLVTGAGSLWTNIDLCVGYYGAGNSMIISNGATVISSEFGSLSLGTTSSNNSVLVTGAGSSWQTPILYVGCGGSGDQLTISNGGLVSNNYAYIGFEGASNTTVLITGQGSMMTNSQVTTLGGFVDGTTNNPDDGSGGSATMILADGGKFASGQLIIGSGSNTVGTLDFGSFGGHDAAGSIVTPLITFGPGQGTMNFNQTNTLSITSTITGLGTVQQLGSGTTILSGSNSYTGTTVIDNGTLVAASSNAFGASTLVFNGGTLETITNLTISTPLTVRDGSTLGITSGATLHLTSNYSSASGATLAVTLASGITPLVVDGTASLAGKLAVSFLNGTYFGNKSTVLSARVLSGTFNQIAMPDPTYFRGRAIYVGDPTYSIITAPTSYAEAAQSQNQVNMANALNSFIPPAGTIANTTDESVVSLALDQLTAAQYPNAFNQISPALYTSFATMAFNNAVAQYNEMVQRLGNIRVAGVGFSQNGFNSFPLQDDNKKATSTNDILIPSADNHWGIFVDGNGIFANVNIYNQLPGYSVESGGVTLGADYKWNETFSTGLYFGYEGAQSKQTEGTSIVDNGSRFGLFGTYQKGGLFANGIVGGDSHSYQVSRGIQFPGLNRTASSAPTAGEFDSLLAGGYDIKRGNWTFGPITSLQYTYFGLQPFTESGAQSLDLSVANANANSLVYSLGSHCFYSWQANKNLLVLPQINLSWEHEFLQNAYALNSALGNGASFDYMSTTPTRNTFFTGIGVTLNLEKKYDASFFYNASACNPSLVSQNFFLSLGMNF